MEWVRRMPKARRTKAKYRVDAVQELKEEASNQRNEKQVRINIQARRLGSKIIDIKNISKKLDEYPIVEGFSYNFARFEKIGIVGNNGSGKTSFLNLLTGQLKPESGTIEVGETVKIAYYKQEGIHFNEQMKVIDAAQEIAEVVTLADGNKLNVSQFLNHFLFTPETQHSYIYKLSGGEKRRLYLATILMQNPNFLILDEPTNDLDILTLNVLEEYLKDYQGCVLVVTHDRFFLDKIIDHLFIFEGLGKIRDFPGNYSDFRTSMLEKENELQQKEREDKKPETIRKKKESITFNAICNI